MGLVVLAIGSLLTGAIAQAAPFAPVKPLGERLKPDGTLRATHGLRGSSDARGWTLTSEPGRASRVQPTRCLRGSGSCGGYQRRRSPQEALAKRSIVHGGRQLHDQARARVRRLREKLEDDP